MSLNRGLWPDFRLVTLFLTVLFSFGLLVSSSIVLRYLLHNTRGYLKSVPALLAGSATTFILSFSALWLARRTSLTKLKFEIPWLLTCTGLVGSFSIWLTRETPGLLFHCGPFFVCHSLRAVFALAWLASLSLAILTLGLIFATVRGRRYYPTIWNSRVEDWRYVAGPDALALPSPTSGKFRMLDDGQSFTSKV